MPINDSAAPGFICAPQTNPTQNRMSFSHLWQNPPASGAPAAAGNVALETAAVTRLLVTEGILDYSGHVSTRIPGRDAFLIQIGSNSRAEVGPESMLVVDYDGKVIEGDGQPP